MLQNATPIEGYKTYVFKEKDLRELGLIGVDETYTPHQDNINWVTLYSDETLESDKHMFFGYDQLKNETIITIPIHTRALLESTTNRVFVQFGEQSCQVDSEYNKTECMNKRNRITHSVCLLSPWIGVELEDDPYLNILMITNDLADNRFPLAVVHPSKNEPITELEKSADGLYRLGILSGSYFYLTDERNDIINKVRYIDGVLNIETCPIAQIEEKENMCKVYLKK